MAKRTGTIAFFKVDNDGFDLGAQRRSSDKNDIPGVQADIAEYMQRLRTGESMDGFDSALGLVVEKQDVAADGEYNLSVERYRKTRSYDSTWPMVTLQEICEFIRNGRNVQQSDQESHYRVTRIQTISNGKFDLAKTKWTNDDVPEGYLLKEGDILFSHINSVDHLAKTAIYGGSTVPVVHGINLLCLRPKEKVAKPHLVLRLMKQDVFVERAKKFAQLAVNQASIKLTDIRQMVLPLPPLEVQQEIVSEIEGYQKVIDGARAVVENYRPHIVVDPEWPVVPIGEICSLINGRAFKPDDWAKVDSGGLPIVRIQNLNTPTSEFNYYTGEVNPRHIVDQGQLLFSWSGSRGTSFGAHIWGGEQAVLNQHIFKVGFDDSRADKRYLFFALNKAVAQVEENLHGGVGLVHITKGNLERIKISLPPLETQQAIVAEVQAEQALVEANRQLIQRFEQKIQAAVGRVWGNVEGNGAVGKSRTA